MCMQIITLPSMKYILYNCLIFSVISTIVIAQIPLRYASNNPCTSKATCHECIQTPLCAWCFDPNYTKKPRCFQPFTSEQPNALCPEEYVLNPDNMLSVIENLALSERQSTSGGGSGDGFYGRGRIVQIAPQRLNLKLRARQSYQISMSYKAQNYPLDLYYLMDLSSSMQDDKDNLSLLADRLAETVRNLTSNFRLGFGSFVDKVVMADVSTHPQNPCTGCAAPYGFKNAMKLSTNVVQFSTEVKNANVSGNLDGPEGGLDALMQAVVCRDHIGWREQARRLLVFSTDASFHYAGDGKLVGIVKPNDGQCHMSEDGIYTESSNQDYPSIEQINLSIKKNAINVIFAVTKETMWIYEELAKNIEGASVGKLDGDSSNIVDLIREQYEKISSTIELKHNASSDVSLKFFSNCLNENEFLVDTNKCEGVKVGNVVQFKIEIEVLKCPKNPKDHFQTIQIYPVGINESLIIDLQMICDCDCEKPGNEYYQINSAYCSSAGTSKCGVCECSPGAFGPKCECTAEGDMKNITMNCINPRTNIECSSRGECTCGHCICHLRQNPLERIYGKYCECDNFSCERRNGKLCGDHGTCDCGECVCDDGWSGWDCACMDSTEVCKPVGVSDDLLCSGHGTCECGACYCDATREGRYTGKYCENCPTCPDRCTEFKDCVQCQMYRTGPLDKAECATNCTKFVPIPVKNVTADESNEDVVCHFEDEEGCRFKFVYYYDYKQVLQVRAQEERDCPISDHIPGSLGTILGVTAAVVFIGMAVLLLWRLLITIRDRREFARLEKEKEAKSETAENPISEQAMSTFKDSTDAGTNC